MSSRLAHIHHGMKQRCLNSKDKLYKDYGGRGITVCAEWADSSLSGIHSATKGFIAFKKWALENGYADNLSLDRIDNNKGYSPEHCRWATAKEQCNNRRSNRWITYKGETKTVAQWLETLGIKKTELT